MILKIISEDLSVCKLSDASGINFSRNFVFFSKTDEELSLVCETEFIPKGIIKRDDGWKAIRIEGELDFSLIGILAKISSILAAAKIGIFAISTYNTDYILVKRKDLEAAISALEVEYEIMV